MQIQLENVTLEADIVLASAAMDGEGKLAVCLHPWSWLGGRMHDPVLESLVEPLHSRNYHVLRYNSRGVGSSSGWPSFTGFKESEDLQSLVQWALKNPEMPNIRSVVIIGYSYGSLIAGTHPVLPSPIATSHILISYPVSVRGWLTLFRTSSYAQKLKDLLNHSAARVLVVYGDQDEFTSEETYSNWRKELENVVPGEGQLQVELVKGTSHFWGGRGRQQLVETIMRWLSA